jgi:hypothetical protein
MEMHRSGVTHSSNCLSALFFKKGSAQMVKIAAPAAMHAETQEAFVSVQLSSFLLRAFFAPYEKTMGKTGWNGSKLATAFTWQLTLHTHAREQATVSAA